MTMRRSHTSLHLLCPPTRSTWAGRAFKRLPPLAILLVATCETTQPKHLEAKLTPLWLTGLSLDGIRKHLFTLGVKGRLAMEEETP